VGKEAPEVRWIVGTKARGEARQILTEDGYVTFLRAIAGGQGTRPPVRRRLATVYGWAACLKRDSRSTTEAG